MDTAVGPGSSVFGRKNNYSLTLMLLNPTMSLVCDLMALSLNIALALTFLTNGVQSFTNLAYV